MNFEDIYSKIVHTKRQNTSLFCYMEVSRRSKSQETQNELGSFMALITGNIAAAAAISRCFRSNSCVNYRMAAHQLLLSLLPASLEQGCHFFSPNTRKEVASRLTWLAFMTAAFQAPSIILVARVT